MAALAGGATQVEAAKVGGVGLRTVTKRLEDPEYRAAVARARGELLARAVGLLAAHAADAAACLHALLTDGGPAAQVSAARAILEFGGRMREELDINERLTAVEAALREPEE